VKPSADKISMTIARFAGLLALTAATRGAALTVDTFDDAVTTKWPPGVVQVIVGTCLPDGNGQDCGDGVHAYCCAINSDCSGGDTCIPQSSSVTDPGLNGVLGGVRQLTVAATRLDLPGLDNVAAGAAVLGDFFDYHASLGAIGNVALRYDQGGAGLNVSIYGFDHFQLAVLIADASSVPYDATVTVEDNTGGSASSTQTITTPGRVTIAWPLASFSSVDLNAVQSITLVIAPNLAADMRVDLFQVVGPPVLMPLLSPAGMLALVVMLGVIGLTTLVRAR